jgi:hypothetical protein
MSNTGIAVKSGSLPRFVSGNNLARQSRDAWMIRWARARVELLAPLILSECFDFVYGAVRNWWLRETVR